MQETGIYNVGRDINKVQIRAAGLVWICAAQFFIAQIVVQWAWATQFSLATNFISDLGNTTCGVYNGMYVCSPWHALMNVSFSLQGVIILTGTLLARPLLRGESTRLLVLILLALTGMGMVGVGVFSEDSSNRGHVISAGIQFITGNVAMIVIGLTGKTLNVNRGWFAASAIFGVVGLAATYLFISGYGFGLGVGGMERIAAYTFPIWLIAAGILLITRLSGRSVRLAVERSRETK